jgi:pullulanase
MKKIILMLLFLMSAYGLSLTVHASELPHTLVVHYYRYDGDYTNFNMWIWEHVPTARGGIQHNFNPENIGEHGIFHAVDLATNYATATTLGIIIKQGGWDGYREIGGDRFMNLFEFEVINGVAHAYFVEQDIRIGKSQADLENNIPDYRDRILTVAFDKQKRVSANLTAIPELGYDLYENDVLIQSGSIQSLRPVITVSSGVDIAKTYTLVVKFNESRTDEQIVSIQNLYDTPEFESLYTYHGELGVSFDGEFTIFRLWAPLSEKVELNLYHQGHPNYNHLGQPSEEHSPFKTEDDV